MQLDAQKEKEGSIVSDETTKAHSDIQAIDCLLKDQPADSAVVMNLKVFNRMMTCYPVMFEIKGKAIVYKGNNHVYFHNLEDGDIRITKADKSLENESF
jgi:hypothetical protein